MFKMKCFVCGKEEYKEGLCEEHYYEYKLKNKKVKINVKYCVFCGNFFYKNKKLDEEKFINKIKKDIPEFDVKIDYDNATIDLFFFNKLHSKNKIEFFVCSECSRIVARSYNLIIQIRNKEKIEKIREKINYFVNKNIFYIIEEKENKNGVDYIIYSKQLNVNKLLGEFKKFGNVKVSSKVVGMRKGKIRKRVTISIT